MNITDISIKRPSLIIVLFSVFTLLGVHQCDIVEKPSHINMEEVF